LWRETATNTGVAPVICPTPYAATEMACGDLQIAAAIDSTTWRIQKEEQK
jgi:hypothetical protein